MNNGQCEDACFVPECNYDAYDCCDYYEVNCGSNLTSATKVLMGIDFMIKNGTYQSASLDTGSGIIGPDQLNSFADEYDLDTSDLQSSNFDDMSSDDQADLGDSPDSVSNSMQSSATDLNKEISANLTVKSIQAMIGSAIKQLKATAAKQAKAAGVALEASIYQIGASQGQRRLSGSNRRLSAVTLTPDQVNQATQAALAAMQTEATTSSAKLAALQVQSFGLNLMDQVSVLVQRVDTVNNALGNLNTCSVP